MAQTPGPPPIQTRTATAMLCHAEYPEDFQQALKRTFTSEEVASLITNSSSSLRFVYDILMLPTVLKYFLGVQQDTEITMVPTTLRGYQLYEFAKKGLPVMLPSEDPDACVEGMLLLGLTAENLNAIHEFESGLMKLVDVKVSILRKDQVGLLDVTDVVEVHAGAFAWKESARNDLRRIASRAWPLGDFVKSQFYDSIRRSQAVTTVEKSWASWFLSVPGLDLPYAGNTV